MVLVPRGVHELSYHYTGPVYWPWARAAFLLGLIISGLLIWRRYRFKSTGFEERAPSGWQKFRGKYLVYFPSAIWLIFLVLLTYKIINEAVFKVPVTILPGPGQMVSGRTVDFYWNYLVGIPKSDQKFQLQVATDRKFANVVETKDVPKAHARFQNAFQEKGPYYYRLRLKTDNKESRWTSPIKFYGRDGKQGK